MRRIESEIEALGSGAGTLKAWTAAVLARAAAFGTALRHRRAVRQLAELDERTLKDIGLSRSDVTGALAQGWGVDPSRTLQVRRVALRARSRPVAPVAGAGEPARAASPAGCCGS